jgi:hypothetical protein
MHGAWVKIAQPLDHNWGALERCSLIIIDDEQTVIYVMRCLQDMRATTTVKLRLINIRSV